MKYLFLLIIGCCGLSVYGHSDFWVVTETENIKTRIKTGYDYEEIQKVQIIGELAGLLAKKLNYNEPILLDFDHYYVGITKPIYFMSFDNGTINYNDGRSQSEMPLLFKEGIVVRQVGSNFDILSTIKLLEYSIQNWRKIKKEQKSVTYNENYCNWTINSTDPSKSNEIINSKESNLVKEIRNEKIYRPGNELNNIVTYYWQNNKFNVVFKELNSEKLLISLDNIYNIQQKEKTVFVFENSASFLVFDTFKKDIVSKKWTIENAEKNYRPYQINRIADDKFSIIFSYYTEEIGIQPKYQILIYAQKVDKLIQDLNKVMHN